MADALPSIPWLLAGPILRQCTPTRLVYWLAVREPALLRIRINPEVGKSRDLKMAPGEPGCRILTAGMHLHYLLIDLRLEEPLPQDCWIGYTIALQGLSVIDGVWLECADWAPDPGPSHSNVITDESPAFSYGYRHPRPPACA